MDKATRNAIGDSVVEACSARYQHLLRTLVPQIGEREAIELVISAATRSLVQLWQGCCQGDPEVVRDLLMAEINKHYGPVQPPERIAAE